MRKILYKSRLRQLQIELVSFQRALIESDLKVLVIFEGRDASGKDGTIKRITQHMSPRETRVVALGKPSDRDISGWYFQRFVPHLPVAQEMVLFNRSWYNRAGVERVMGFCSELQHEQFLRDVGPFESLLLNSGIQLVKFYLDITKEEQVLRLRSRRLDPLKQWKTSPIDEAAVELWDEYTAARDAMLSATHTDAAPWTIVLADDKRRARINVLRHLLRTLHNSHAAAAIDRPNPDVLFRYEPGCEDRLAR
ncbi:MAG: polyphosphate kinase 2 [Gammaproteobacteria bacterium]|jgi:polyphosphate kinase 2